MPRGPPDLILKAGRIFWVPGGGSGGPQGPGKAFQNVGADGPHIFEGFPGAPQTTPHETHKSRPDFKVRSGGPLDMHVMLCESSIIDRPGKLGPIEPPDTNPKQNR